MRSRRLILLLIAALFVSPLLRGHRRWHSNARRPSIRAAVVIIHAPIMMPRGSRHFPVSPTSGCIPLEWKIEETTSLLSRESPPYRLRLLPREATSIRLFTGLPLHLVSPPLRC